MNLFEIIDEIEKVDPEITLINFYNTTIIK